jgi:hypothetical protein
MMSKLGKKLIDAASPVLPASAGEAGAPEIEITSEMLERGIQAFLVNRSMEYETEDEVVGLILRAVLGDLVKFS